MQGDNNKIMKVINLGVTRHVLLIGDYAVKIPRLNYGWRLFLLGLLANMQETHFGNMDDKRVCPVIFGMFGGWFIIMPRCAPITDSEFKELVDLDYFWNQEFDHSEFEAIPGVHKVPVEYKADSFAWYKGQIVAVDYGS